MKIARIVSSNSHIDYVARIIDSLDSTEPPGAEDYGFGQFVRIPLDGGPEVVGVIYNSMLVNPDYSNFGPRLSPKPELGAFSPDYLNEQGFLIAILLLGTQGEDGRFLHGVPRRVVPPGQSVFRIDAAEVRKFHSDENDCLQIHYYSQVVAHAGPMEFEDVAEGQVARRRGRGSEGEGQGAGNQGAAHVVGQARSAAGPDVPLGAQDRPVQGPTGRA